MAFKINDFTGKLTGGGARPNLFKVKIPALPEIAVATGEGLNDFEFLCRNVQIPASIVSTIPISYQGRETKFSGDREFGELSTTVINDEGYEVRNTIESWMDGINTHSDNIILSEDVSRSIYTTDLTIETLTKQGKVDQTYKFIGCWPSNLDAMSLNWDSTNQILEFSITWQYDYFTHSQANIS